MNLLDRYVFKSVLFTCAAAVGLFTFIVVVPNFLKDLLPHVLAGHLSAMTLGKLVFLLLPHAITYALPMGMLTGVLLTLGRLSADSEITAMRAAGVSVPRAARPVLLLALLGVAAGLYFNFEWMPSARVEYHRVLVAGIRSNPLSLIVSKTFIRSFPGYVVYVGDNQAGVMRDFWLWELDDQSRVKRLVRADTGQFDYEESTNSFVLTLHHAQVEARSEKNPETFVESPLVGSFEQSAATRLSLERFFGRGSGARMKQEWLTYDLLQAERQRVAALPTPADPVEAEKAAVDRLKLDLIFHDKINISLAVLSLTLIGVPLGIRVSRRETSANFGVAVGVTLAYYLMTVAIKGLDRHPELHPDLLLWLPNLLLIGAGGWLMMRIERR